MSDPTFHRCPVPGCDVADVPRDRFACAPHWYALPVRIRRAISTYYLTDPSRHQDAMGEAFEWYAERAKTPVGTRKTDASGQLIEWTGTAWRQITRAEQDRDAWKRSRE